MMGLLALLTLCILLKKVDTLVECLNCEGVEVLQCRSTCTGNSCYISMKNDLSLQFGCSNEPEVDMCITTVSLEEVQSVSCYCSADSCNGPAALIKYFLVNRRIKRESLSASVSVTFGSSTLSANKESENGQNEVSGGTLSTLSAQCTCANNKTECVCANNSTQEATNETLAVSPDAQTTIVANTTAPATTTSVVYLPTSEYSGTVLATTATSTDVTPNATTPSPTISPQQPSVVRGPAANQSDGITAVVNSVLSRIGVIMDNFKNNPNPLVQSVLDDFENSQEKLKQQIDKLLAFAA